jgi:hypothetical protein
MPLPLKVQQAAKSIKVAVADLRDNHFSFVVQYTKMSLYLDHDLECEQGEEDELVAVEEAPPGKVKNSVSTGVQ